MKFQLLLLILALGYISCQKTNTSTTAENKSCGLSGRYFNRTVLDQCPQKSPADVLYYSLELSFDGGDSVFIFNGFEKYKLPYTKTDGDCNYKILAATQFGDMPFTAIGDSVIQLLDSSWTKTTSTSLFKVASLENRKEWDFDNFYNECVIAGMYLFHKKDQKPTQAYILPNGQLSGMVPFLSYSLCYAGDCLEETKTPASLIEFTDDKGDTRLYAYKMVDGKSHIQFFEVGPPIPDIKGERSIGPLAFELKSAQVQE